MVMVVQKLSQVVFTAMGGNAETQSSYFYRNARSGNAECFEYELFNLNRTIMSFIWWLHVITGLV